MNELDFKARTFDPGVYEVRVVKMIKITVHDGGYTVNESTLCAEVLALGTLDSWSVEKKGELEP
jgi:hypothetical protein